MNIGRRDLAASLDGAVNLWWRRMSFRSNIYVPVRRKRGNYPHVPQFCERATVRPFNGGRTRRLRSKNKGFNCGIGRITASPIIDQLASLKAYYSHVSPLSLGEPALCNTSRFIRTEIRQLEPMDFVSLVTLVLRLLYPDNLYTAARCGSGESLSPSSRSVITIGIFPTEIIITRRNMMSL